MASSSRAFQEITCFLQKLQYLKSKQTFTHLHRHYYQTNFFLITTHSWNYRIEQPYFRSVRPNYFLFSLHTSRDIFICGFADPYLSYHGSLLISENLLSPCRARGLFLPATQQKASTLPSRKSAG